MPRLRALAWILGLSVAGSATAQAADFSFERDAPTALAAGAIPVDARPLEACLERSIAGARCLPAADFLGPHRRLASWRDILWVLGAAGLKGDETVLVAGAAPAERDFVAGLLHIAGAHRVLVSAEPVSRLLEQGVPAGPGMQRAFARNVVFEAPMRDRLVVLARELRAAKPAPFLLDGRSEGEYWGEVVRAARGGHLPGAQGLPADRLRAARESSRALLPGGSPVAYGHDALEGIAYLAVLRAGHGVDARVYPGGWAEWAADSALPADAVSYPDRGARAAAPVAEGNRAPPWWAWLGVALGLAGIAFVAGHWSTRRRVA